MLWQSMSEIPSHTHCTALSIGRTSSQLLVALCIARPRSIFCIQGGVAGALIWMEVSVVALVVLYGSNRQSIPASRNREDLEVNPAIRYLSCYTCVASN